ncbi:ABC-2 type transport system ATP-binding protein [Amycolatopsis xylanica]|uniref:ABC-2 type transport system ATP-binding protein n=1 Tax=Amycolatopsis xylanica TaxID=589385 RepID=A0A1H3SDF7_9PSEU|nr:ATP-binding cassette domain-containing protein [Amycolatopsis xylanica]SDZ35738.1 ABC-2 type transport system ATP-binding protein [Amycolatopsis xylanica]
MNVVEVRDLTKSFKVRKPDKESGPIRNLLRPRWEYREALSGLSFSVAEGEIVGLLGSNGAGKSTTMKCLCGILLPTSGSVRVSGLDPFRDRAGALRELGVVFGQKTTLWWDVPVIETYRLLRRIYDVSQHDFDRVLENVTEVLGLADFLHTSVRQLSLGQRVRADLGAAFLHRPKVLFLDEPTIGLDVAAKSRLREFVKRIRDETGVTILLTTHDLRDIELLSDRIILIDKGGKLFEGTLAETIARFSPYTTVKVELSEDIHGPFEVPGALAGLESPLTAWVRFRREDLPITEVTGHLMRHYPVRDFTVEEPRIEEIVRQFYTDGLEIPVP